MPLGRAHRDLQHAAPAGRPRRQDSGTPGRLRGAGHGAAGVGGVPGRRPADRRRPGLREASRASNPRRSSASRRRRGSTSRIAGTCAARPRWTCCPTCWPPRCATCSIPKQLRLGRAARRREGRAAVRPADPLAAVPLRRPRRAVRHHPHGARRSSSLVQDIRSGAVTFGHRFLDDERPRRARHQGEGVRRLPPAPGRELRHRRTRRTPRPHRARARRRSPTPRRPRRGVAGRAGRPRRGARPGRVSRRRRRHVPRRVPAAAGGSADDHDDPPPALLSAGHEPRRPDAGVPRRAQHGAGEAAKPSPATSSACSPPACATRASSGTPIAQQTLEQHRARLDTVLFHKALGSYPRQGGAARAAGPLDRRRRLRPPEAADPPAAAARLCKADLATDMVREFTELQGTMGGIYARDEGQPEAVWKAIYHHYLPTAVEPTARRPRRSAGRGAPSPGRPCRWPTSSTRSSACSWRASGRPARAIRSALRRAGAGRCVRIARGPAGTDRRRSRGDLPIEPRLTATAVRGVQPVMPAWRRRAALAAFLRRARCESCFEQRGCRRAERARGDAPGSRALVPLTIAPPPRRAAGVHGHGRVQRSSPCSSSA